jgi:hypothetical protein
MNIHKRTRLKLLDRQKIYYLNKLRDLFSVSPKGSFSLFLKEYEFRFNYGLPTQQLKILKLWTRFNLIYYSRPLRKINGLMARSFVLNSTFIKLLCHSTALSTQSVCAFHRLPAL